MTEKFILKGEWFLPTSKERRVHGTLTFDPEEGAELDLQGNLNGNEWYPDFTSQDIILGLTSDSKQVTLYQCRLMRAGGAVMVHDGESGKPVTTYSITYVLIGLHAETAEDLNFNTVSAEIFNLDEWLGISGFLRRAPKTDQIKNYEVSVEYKLPEPIEFDINETTKGRFYFVANRPGISRHLKSVTIKQQAYFQATFENERSITELLKCVITFQNLLMLALYRSTYPLAISLTGEKHVRDFGDGEIIKKPIKLYFSSRHFKFKEKPKFDVEMIFDYQRIKSDFQNLIKEWYAKYELLEPAFDLLFEQFYNTNAFTVNTFLNLAQSAETFHARVHNHTKIPRDDYKKMKEAILQATPMEYHSWLNDQFSFGNHLRLHTRLTELTAKYSNPTLDVILGDKEQFVLNVKNSRNYYTHYSSDGQKKALKGGELFYLSERLKVLLVCSFLMEVGFDKTKLSSYLANVKWQLFAYLADWRTNKSQVAPA